MIATEYKLRLTRVTSKYTDDGDVLYGSHGIERPIDARVIISENDPDCQIDWIIKGLGEQLVKRLMGEA